MPSHKANKYGTACEKRMADKYRLTLERASWKDARDRAGNPVEIKSAAVEHANGQPGTLKVYEAYHRRLRAADGYYVLTVYQRHGRGLRVLASEKLHSSRLPRLSWHGGGDHRGTRQAKIPVSFVLDG